MAIDAAVETGISICCFFIRLSGTGVGEKEGERERVDRSLEEWWQFPSTLMLLSNATRNKGIGISGFNVSIVCFVLHDN